MSIWTSIRPTDGDLVALDGADPGAEYRGEGPEVYRLDVATASWWHDRIRLAVFDGPEDVDVLLRPDVAEKLAGDLMTAAAQIRAERVDASG